MKNRTLIITLLLACSSLIPGKLGMEAIAAESSKSGNELEATDVGSTEMGQPTLQKSKDEKMQWWREARLGCFMHWGAYSQLGNEWNGKKGGGYAEHIQRVLKISMADYKKDAVDKFNPVKFDADAWIALIKRAGMGYYVITAKHHDGFAMYDSKVDDYNIVKQTPWKHDPMRDLEAACAKNGMAFGFYYSHAFDWGNQYAPGNDWEWKNPGGDLQLGGRDWWKKDPEKLKSVQENYVNKKAIPQIRELIANYHPKIFWFDTPSKLPDSENKRILEAVRQADPSVVVNSRLVRTDGDYQSTGDRAVEFQMLDKDWEAIPTTNESYGWNPLDPQYKTPEFLIRVLAKAVSRGGNILLNVGPTRDGAIDPHDVAILEGIGDWMTVYGDSIHGCNASPLPPQPWGVVTSKASSLFLHVFDWTSPTLVVGGLDSEPLKAFLITSGAPVPLHFKRLNQHDLAIMLPPKAPNATDSVIRLEFANPPKASGVRLLSNRTKINQLLAFDAERHQGEKTGTDSRLGYRDGKLNNYCVDNWTTPEQWLSWDVRVSEPVKFDVSLNYGKGLGGEYELSCGDWKSSKKAAEVAPPVPSIASPQVDQLGTLTLEPGVHRIELRVTKANGKGEIFRPLELWLTPKR
ncbi:MAG: alpha-L-fucosidase [Proteobacteria bacterium]|nr:alpha-L-fucosidase [Pseudomonadota bacterium]